MTNSKVHKIIIWVNQPTFAKIIVFTRSLRVKNSWRAMSTSTEGKAVAQTATTEEMKSVLLEAQHKHYLIKYLDKDNNPLTKEDK